MKKNFGGDTRIRLEGSSVGFWFVEKYLGSGKYRCMCVCGKQKVISSASLNQGDSKSCSCQTKKLNEIRRENRQAKAPVKREKFE